MALWSEFAFFFSFMLEPSPPSKTTASEREENFCTKSFHLKMDLKKYANTRGLHIPYYGKMVEKENKTHVTYTISIITCSTRNGIMQ